MYIHTVRTTKGKAASQRDISMEETELDVPQGASGSACESVSVCVRAHD